MHQALSTQVEERWEKEGQDKVGSFCPRYGDLQQSPAL
jgi:hypothetical protein